MPHYVLKRRNMIVCPPGAILLSDKIKFKHVLLNPVEVIISPYLYVHGVAVVFHVSGKVISAIIMAHMIIIIS